MSEATAERPLQPGDRAPDIVLDAITRDGKVALADYRGQNPVLIGLFRGLHCPFCRRHIAALAELEPELRSKGVESLAVINTPIERARLYYRYHPLPNLLAAADPERRSHRAFGLPNLQFTENETEWPRKISMDAMMSMRVAVSGETPEPMNPFAAMEFLDKKDGYVETEADHEMMATGMGQLVGQFLLDRDGVVRWCFTEDADGGRGMFQAPAPQELMTAATLV